MTFVAFLNICHAATFGVHPTSFFMADGFETSFLKDT